jgi:hypothetical protein
MYFIDSGLRQAVTKITLAAFLEALSNAARAALSCSIVDRSRPGCAERFLSLRRIPIPRLSTPSLSVPFRSLSHLAAIYPRKLERAAQALAQMKESDRENQIYR